MSKCRFASPATDCQNWNVQNRGPVRKCRLKSQCTRNATRAPRTINQKWHWRAPTTTMHQGPSTKRQYPIGSTRRSICTRRKGYRHRALRSTAHDKRAAACESPLSAVARTRLQPTDPSIEAGMPQWIGEHTRTRFLNQLPGARARGDRRV